MKYKDLVTKYNLLILLIEIHLGNLQFSFFHQVRSSPWEPSQTMSELLNQMWEVIEKMNTFKRYY